MNIYVLGGGGYVGSAYQRLLNKLDIPCTVVTRVNYESLIATPCDVLINANGNSKKFMSDQDPLWDFDASVRSVIKALLDFKPGFSIHLSSGDVYPQTSSPEVSCEDQVIDAALQSRYGLHKHLAEGIVRGMQPNHLIMRMGGFVGPGMKKNAIFDMLNDQPVWLAPESELQFISTDKAAELVWGLFQAGVKGETVNLGSEGVVKIGEIHKRLNSKSEFQQHARKVRFEISTEKLAGLSSVAIPKTSDEVEAFFQTIDR